MRPISSLIVVHFQVGAPLYQKPAMDPIGWTVFIYTRPGLGKAGCGPVDPGRCLNDKFFSQGGYLAVNGLQVLWALPDPFVLHPGVVYAVTGRAGSKF